MTPKQIQLIQDSFAKLIPISTQVADDFYNTLFTLDPSVKKLFRGSMAEQKFKLMASLQMIVLGLERPKIIVSELKELAKRHVYYGVKVKHYDIVGQALVDALNKSLGADFTDETKAAWIEAYTMISSIMIKASEEA